MVHQAEGAVRAQPQYVPQAVVVRDTAQFKAGSPVHQQKVHGPGCIPPARDGFQFQSTETRVGHGQLLVHHIQYSLKTEDPGSQILEDLL